NGVIRGIRNVDDAFGVDHESRRRVEAGGCADAVGESLCAAGNGADVALRRDAADCVGLAGTAYVDRAVRSYRHGEGVREGRLEGVPVAMAVPPCAGEQANRRGPSRAGPRRRCLVEQGPEVPDGEGNRGRQEEETGKNGPIGAERRVHGPLQYARCHLWRSGTNRLNRCNVSESGPVESGPISRKSEQLMSLTSRAVSDAAVALLISFATAAGASAQAKPAAPAASAAAKAAHGALIRPWTGDL